MYKYLQISWMGSAVTMIEQVKKEVASFWDTLQYIAWPYRRWEREGAGVWARENEWGVAES